MPASSAKTAAVPSGLACRMALLGADVRLTPHRREVYEVLAASMDHPTAIDLFTRVKERSSGISLATVYNCLEHLTTAGLIKQVHLERGQSRYCANLQEHVHFYCETCGQVTDAHPSAEFDPATFWKLPKGTQINRLDVAIHGICAGCAQPQ